MLEECASANPDGAGIAWASGATVRWKKGLDVDGLMETLKGVKSHFAVHFRWATVGGKTHELTHPFVVDKGASTETSGSAPKVLMHNGHWNNWQETMKKVAARRHLTPPLGQWSDTRALAWVAAVEGERTLRRIVPHAGRVALITPGGIELFGSWVKRYGLKFSNLNWKTAKYSKSPHSYCSGGTATGLSYPTFGASFYRKEVCKDFQPYYPQSNYCMVCGHTKDDHGVACDNFTPRYTGGSFCQHCGKYFSDHKGKVSHADRFDIVGEPVSAAADKRLVRPDSGEEDFEPINYTKLCLDCGADNTAGAVTCRICNGDNLYDGGEGE